MCQETLGYEAKGEFTEIDPKGWQKLLDWAQRKQMELRLECLQSMAAAYFHATDIPPEEVVLVEDTTEGQKIRFYYERREKLKVCEEKFTGVSIEKSIETHLSLHEILLSFVDDSGAVYWSTWWDDIGSRLFAAWLVETGNEGLLR